MVSVGSALGIPSPRKDERRRAFEFARVIKVQRRRCDRANLRKQIEDILVSDFEVQVA